MKTKNLLVLFLFISMGHATAQDAWTLDKCITHALNNNISIKQYEIASITRNYELQESKADFLPTVNGNTSYNMTFGRSVDPFTNSFTSTNVQSLNLSITGSMTLFGGMQKLNTMRQRSVLYKASVFDLEKVKNDISLQVAAFYLQILFDKENVDNAQRQLENTHVQIEITKKKVEVGSLPQGSYLEIVAQEASEQSILIGAQNNLDNSYLSLMQLIEIDSANGFDIFIPELELLDTAETLPAVPFYFNKALRLPQIKAAEQRLESSKMILSIARAGLSPTLSLSASVSSGYSDARKLYDSQEDGVQAIGYVGTSLEPVYTPKFTSIENNYPVGDQLSDNQSSNISLNLNIPIFNNLRTRTNIQSSRLSVENNELLIEQSNKDLYKEVQKAHNDAMAAQKRYKAAFRALKAQEEAFRYTQQKYDLGMINTIEYNLSKNNVSRAQSDFVIAKYDYIFKMNILNFYAGGKIVL